MLNLSEFLTLYPDYELFQFGANENEMIQRIYNLFLLVRLDEELLPIYEVPEHHGKGYRNYNQTRTHYQCYGCRRLLRNDKFFCSRSHQKANTLGTYCKKCSAVKNKENYNGKSKQLTNGRLAIWQYIAPECSICGYNRHSSALEMHHLVDKKNNIGQLITKYAASPLIHNAEKLLRECRKCIPVCANCHREHHHGIPFPDIEPRKYNLVDFLAIPL